MQKLMLVVSVVIILSVLGGCNTPATKSISYVAQEDIGLTPEMIADRDRQQDAHNVYVRRLVEGGHLEHQEKVNLGEDKVALIYDDVRCWRARETERLAEIRAENPSEYVIPQDNTMLGTGLH